MIETGISFGNIHSYYDLNLILSGSEIPPAKPKTTYIDIAGGDGSIDLTEATGEVKFHDRECKFTFTMNPSDDLSDVAFEEKKTEVSNALNGKRFKITLDKDDGYFYEGRCTVSEFLSNKRLRQIVVTATVKPYKFKQKITTLTFGLSEEEQTIIVKNSRKTESPTIICSHDDTKIVCGTTSFNLNGGIHTVPEILFVEGENEIKISGNSNGAIGFIFQEGVL